MTLTVHCNTTHLQPHAFVAFLPFSREEARTWLDHHGNERRLGAAESRTLAELYGLLHGQLVEDKARVGFAR